MSRRRHNTSVDPQLSLILHTAIDFVHGQGVGIGIVVHETTGTARNSSKRIEKHKYSVKRSQFSTENVKTQERAHMFAILHAMGLARGTTKRRRTATLRIQKVVVLCGSSKVINLVNFRRDHGPECLERVTSTNDRSMIKRVLKDIRVLTRREVDVTIAEDGQEGTSEFSIEARTMARQKGRKACRDRRRARYHASMETSTLR